MKKHIIGFALFSLIVGSAVFVRAIFKAPNEFVNFSVDYRPVTKKSCWKMKEELAESELPVVRQALLDLNSKRMDWAVYVPKADSPVALHFFVKDPDGAARYINTEIAPAANFSGNKVITYTSSYISLHNFSSYQNLYIVPESVSRTDAEMKTFNPVFDEKLATPVTLYSGKATYRTFKK